MIAPRTSLAALCLVATAAAQDGVQVTRSPFVQGLQREIHELEQRVAEEARHFERLMRLKVCWELLLPFDPAELLRGCDPGERSAEDLAKELAAELDEEARLKRRFVAEGAREPELPPPGQRLVTPRVGDPVAAGPTRVGATPDPAPGPGAGTNREPSRTGTGKGPLLPGAPGTAAARTGPLVPLLELPGPRLEASAALDPFDQGGGAIRLEPVAYVPKRARALLRAGLTAEALGLLRRTVEGVETPEPVLLFLLARAHERLGDLDAAKAAYQRVIELDQGRDAEGGQVFGLWARSANFVLQHLRWKAETLPITPPDLEGLR